MKKLYGIKQFKMQQLGYGLFILFVSSILGSCGSKKDTLQNYNELQELINSREFLIEKQWVQPLGGGIIDLIENHNFMQFKGDRVKIFLPYFGVRHAGGGYGSNDAGIIYEGPLENLKINEEQNRRIVINFEGRHDNEILQFYIILFPNGVSETSVTSSERNKISYRGFIKELPASQ